MRRTVFLLMAVFILGALFNISWSFNDHEFSNDPYENLLRFHVIANSDMDKDQELKLKVRDVILDKIGMELEKARTLEEARTYILSNLSWLEKIAQNEIDKRGYSYPVVVVLGKTDYPTRSYGNMILPAGTYESLRIIIGEGKGSNWWCVLFPPLCFIDITHSIAQNNDMFGEEEDVLEESIQIRFRFVEIIRDILK